MLSCHVALSVKGPKPNNTEVYGKKNLWLQCAQRLETKNTSSVFKGEVGFYKNIYIGTHVKIM